MTDGLIAELAHGLSRPQKELSPKWFYDHRGSELFDQITRLPEYYLTRAERALLEAYAPRLVAAFRPATLVELGAGTAEKTRVLLDAMCTLGGAVAYVPIDISSEFLETAADALREAYPSLEITPVAADIAEALQVPPDLGRPALFALLGSTIGNFRPARAVRLLRMVRSEMRDTDRFLMGVDLVKDPPVLEAAYNDGAGVTAAFNLNVLNVLNQEVGADFEPADFRHRAFYDPEKRRIEMHLVAERAVTARIPGVGSLSLREGESLRTELSHKYDRESVAALFHEAGFTLEDWVAGEPGFALSVGGRA
ncbi:MAG TPA: L-histidine N(alpha)-methyltransferase [Longimicrobiales bacterium]|nr:L-histidine N(alpha)-methyltransferase [Longimicrobiales bacterium]